MIAVYIPCKDGVEAGKIARHLLMKKLVACASMWPVRSLYYWKGKLVDNPEVIVFAKTVESKYKAIVKEATSVHSYDVPAIIKIPVGSNKDYEKWLKQEVRSK